MNCWMAYVEGQEKITAAERAAIENFFLLDRWREMTDIVMLFTVKPEVALDREHQDRLTTVQGQAMNLPSLAEINAVYESMANGIGRRFNRFELYDTSEGTTPRETALRVAETILDEMATASRESLQ